MKKITKEESKELLGGVSFNPSTGVSENRNKNKNTTCNCSCLYANSGYMLQNINNAERCSCQCR